VISVDYPFPSVSDLTKLPFHKSTADLVYFRSNKNSVIRVKEFRSVIGSIFRIGVWPTFGEVDIFFQTYNVLPQYPFPNDLYRPLLEYPFVEFYRGSQITRYIYADEVMNVIEKEQD